MKIRLFGALALLALSSTALAGKVKVPGLEVNVPGNTNVEVNQNEANVNSKVTPADEASCTVAVPANVTVVRGENAYNGVGGTFLVCPNAKVAFNGTDARVFVQGPAVVDVNGTGTQLTGAGGGQINVNGAMNNIVTDSPAKVAITGLNNPVHSCPTVTLDLSALASGC